MAFLDVFDKEIRDGLCRAAELVRRHRRVQLFSHYDADGVTSMAIVKIALEREGIETDYVNFTTLTDTQMDIVRDTPFECMVMTDLGTSYLGEIEALGRDCVVLDHHALPPDVPAMSRTVFVNPWSVGVNGSEHSCAATVAFLFAMAMDEDNFDLCQIAIAGMIGDYQHRTGFDQYNRIVVDEAVRRGHILKMDSICPIGRISDFFRMTIDPYCKGLTGNLEAISKALEGFSDTLEYGDTDLAGKIEDIVVGNLRGNGVSEEEISKVLRTRYYLRDYGVDAGRLSEVLDACGRNGKTSLALEVIGRKDLSPGIGVFESFRRGIVEQFMELEDGGVHELENIQYFVHHTPASGGIIGTSVLKFFGCDSKPVAAFIDMGDRITLSFRSNQRILDMGVELNRVLTAIQDRHGASCGGHPKASGGTLVPGTMEAFIEDLDAEVGRVKALHRPA
ncbi:MAG: DHH family phosphoesterase [archaeon]|nr:DHH family phosphoesterase [archaeon]